MGMKWTTEQLDAINSEGSVIVSAAAGSGKTTVLVERIMRLVKTCDIDRMLIVTFTNAAAAGMREDITDALEKAAQNADAFEAEHYRRQLLLLPGAKICTIHSFCSALIKDNFEKLGLAPDFSLCDPAGQQIIFDECMQSFFEEAFEKEDADFLVFAEAFCGSKNDAALFDIVKRVYEFSRTLPYPDRWFDEVSGVYARKNEDWKTEVVRDAKNRIMLASDVYLTGASEFLKDKPELSARCGFLSSDASLFASVAAAKTYSELYEIVKKPSFARLTVKKEELGEVADLRETVKKQFTDISGKSFKLSEEEITSFLTEQEPHINALISVVKAFGEHYAKAKHEKSVMDFNDLEHFAISLLSPNGDKTDTAKAISAEYDYIVVDEYQDTNEVQEAILSSISDDEKNIFMVGDIKQSIYRFRNTAPELFLNKVESFSDDGSGDGRRIFLNRNFRSRKNIIDFANLVFSQIMSKESGGVDYTEQEELKFGAEYYPVGESAVELFLNQKDSGKDRISDAQAESYIIAEQINKLMDSGFEVYDKKTGNMRPLMYKDIAILLRSAKNISDVITTTLTECGLPVFSDDDGSALLKSYETAVIISFLKITDNPRQDIPLAAVLRSPVFSFSDDLLTLIRKNAGKELCFYDALLLCDDKKAVDFAEFLNRYRAMSKYTSPSQLIQMFLDETGFEEFARNMQGGGQRCSNIRYLCTLATEYEKSGAGSLYGFINYLERFENSQTGSAPKILPDSTDVITVTTIHKSKGLEYPVVFIPMLGKKMNKRDLGDSYLCHKQAGFGINLTSYKNNTKITSPIKNAIALTAEREFIEEELRVLYVALTRAREKLILTGSVTDIDKFVNSGIKGLMYDERALPPYLVTSCTSFLEWIHISLARTGVFPELHAKDELSGLCDIRVHLRYLPQMPESINTSGTNVRPQGRENSSVAEILSYKYPGSGSKVFSKYSVSELKRMEEDDKYSKEYFERLVPLSESSVKTSASRVGSVFHLVLENITDSMGDSREHINNVISSLINKGFITQDEAKTVDVGKIISFYNSEVGSMLKNADRIYKERSFNIFADNIIEGQTEPVQLQGVIDCYFETDDGFVVLDFKTDYITDNNIDEKTQMYTKQLSFYKKAVSVMHKTTDIRCFICYFNKNIQIEV